MPWSSLLIIALGASLGAWCRWGLAIALNPLFPSMALGTLAANLSGGLLIGILMEAGDRLGTMGPELRLLLITGFLGAFTTFSAFSAELAFSLRQGDYFWGVATAAAHVIGSVALTGIGMLLALAILRGVP